MAQLAEKEDRLCRFFARGGEGYFLIVGYWVCALDGVAF